MNNIIEIKGASFSNVKKALKNWIELYSDNFSSKLIFKVFEKGINRQIIVADNRLENEHFFYLVNYLEYQEGIEYKVEIKGFTKGKNIDKRLNNKDLLIYISKIDKDYDHVYAVTKDNRHYKIDFGGKVTELNDNKVYSSIDINELRNPITLSTNIINKKLVKKHNSESKISKRFKIIFYISITAVFIHFFIPNFTEDIEIIEKWTFFTGMGFGIWFLMDYEMLRLNDFYIKSLLIAIGFLSYGYLFRNYYQSSISTLTNVNFIYPLSSLITQYPIRYLYKLILKREPKVDKQGKFADLIYTIILFFASAILPLIMSDYLK